MSNTCTIMTISRIVSGLWGIKPSMYIGVYANSSTKVVLLHFSRVMLSLIIINNQNKNNKIWQFWWKKYIQADKILKILLSTSSSGHNCPFARQRILAVFGICNFSAMRLTYSKTTLRWIRIIAIATKMIFRCAWQLLFILSAPQTWIK